MAMSLMHGPSMAVAEQTGALAAHLSPHASHAAHSEHHASKAVPGQADSSAHHNMSPNASPSCPLANVVAIASVAPVCSLHRIGTRLEILTQPAPLSVRLAALDPPPRLTA
jgi:hypothetical protein